MKDRIETIIRDWLNRDFKNPNAIPTPMLKALAEEIDKHRWEIYSYTKDEYDLEDIEMVADNKEVELSKDEQNIALGRYKKAQEYDSSLDMLDEIVDKIIESRKEKK